MAGYIRSISKTSYNEVQIKYENRYVWVMMVKKQAYAEYLLYVRPLVYVISFNSQQTFERESVIPIYVITAYWTQYSNECRFIWV